MIRDNVLDLQAFESFYQQIKQTPFVIGDYKVRKGDDIQCLSHIVYEDHNRTSDMFNLIHTYFSVPLDISSWWRIRICLTWKESISRVFGYHTDYDENISCNDYKYEHMKTAIYYLNDTNGPTVFRDSDKSVQCVKNRLLIFPSTERHSGSSHTEGDDLRMVVNFNYF
tara:strand:- start:193 stop:696 length:504 start_codon:yes stop_codon:yes gene_type:complete